MLIQFPEQIINNFLIPAFTLDKGEFIVIRLSNNTDGPVLMTKLIDLLTGKAVNSKVIINTPLRFVEHPEIYNWKGRLFPPTVATYHRRCANKANLVFREIYQEKWIQPNTKVRDLPGNQRKKLALYTALSWSDYIVFDLGGTDPYGSHELVNRVEQAVNNGGAAVLIDFRDEFKADCTAFIKAQYLYDNIWPLFDASIKKR